MRVHARGALALSYTHTRTHQAKWQEAAEAFGEAIRECDSSHTLYTNRALCYQKLQRWPEVEQVLSAMCVYVYVCVCMCVYTCIWLYEYVLCVCVCVCVCMSALYVYVCMYTCAYGYM